MATLLNALLTQRLLPFIVFLCSFILFYIILLKTKLLPGTLSAIASLLFSFLLATSQKGVEILSIFLPWFTLVSLVIFIIIVIASGFGGGSLLDDFKKKAVPIFLVLGLIIFIISLLHVFNKEINENIWNNLQENEDTSEKPTTWTQELIRTIFHPYFIGIIIIFLIFGLSIIFLSSQKS